VRRGLTRGFAGVFGERKCGGPSTPHRCGWDDGPGGLRQNDGASMGKGEEPSSQNRDLGHPAYGRFKQVFNIPSAAKALLIVRHMRHG
jgi:hypothetical protein